MRAEAAELGLNQSDYDGSSSGDEDETEPERSEIELSRETMAQPRRGARAPVHLPPRVSKVTSRTHRGSRGREA